jgi:hypothetical protein
MDESPYMSSRLLARACPYLDAVSEFAQERDWPLVGDESRGRRREVRWRMAHALTLHYVEDGVIMMCYMFIASSIATTGEGYARIMRDKLDIVPIAEIINMVDRESDPIRLGRQIIRLGVAAPRVYDDDVFARMSSALRSPDHRVREMAAWAITFSSYPEFRPVLRMLVQDDPVQKVREGAAMVLEAFDRAGVPEP